MFAKTTHNQHGDPLKYFFSTPPFSLTLDAYPRCPELSRPGALGQAMLVAHLGTDRQTDSTRQSWPSDVHQHDGERNRAPLLLMFRVSDQTQAQQAWPQVGYTILQWIATDCHFGLPGIQALGYINKDLLLMFRCSSKRAVANGAVICSLFLCGEACR